MSDLFDIKGRAFVVTGGAGYLGRHFCAALANAGAHVLCLSSRAGEFDDLLKPRVKVESEVCDVSDEAVVAAALERFVAKRHFISGFVNNAMRAPRGIDIEMSKTQFSGALDSILTQYFTCAKLVLPYIPAQGAIVNVASMWGLVSPSPEMYLDLKNEPCLPMPPAAAGILSLTRYLAALVGSRNIRVNALVPGCFPKKRGPDRPDYMREMTKRIPLGRIGKPEELVGALLFLLSNAASYVTGQQIVVDGGYTIR